MQSKEGRKRDRKTKPGCRWEEDDGGKVLVCVADGRPSIEGLRTPTDDLTYYRLLRDLDTGTYYFIPSNRLSVTSFLATFADSYSRRCSLTGKSYPSTTHPCSTLLTFLIEGTCTCLLLARLSSPVELSISLVSNPQQTCRRQTQKMKFGTSLSHNIT